MTKNETKLIFDDNHAGTVLSVYAALFDPEKITLAIQDQDGTEYWPASLTKEEAKLLATHILMLYR